jgi:hypothetical protein
MRKFLFGLTAIVMFAAGFLAMPSPAQAQLDISVSANDPLTKLPPDKWVYVMTHEINGSVLIGKPLVYVLNPNPESLTVMCGKWQLVGPMPDKAVKGNPHELPAWKMTMISTDQFDGYCKDGVVGMSSSGERFVGKLTSMDETFSNATFITMLPAKP